LFPQVDWDVVADRAGYNNSSTAKVRYGQIKKALGFQDDGTFSATVTPTKSRGPRAKKEKTVGSGANGTPSKVVKKRTPKKKIVKDAEPEEEGEATMDDAPSHEDGHEDGHQNCFEEQYE
jgi:hypothetical protein